MQIDNGESFDPVLPYILEIVEESVQVSFSDFRIPFTRYFDEYYLMPDPYRHSAIVRDVVNTGLFLYRLFCKFFSEIAHMQLSVEAFSHICDREGIGFFAKLTW